METNTVEYGRVHYWIRHAKPKPDLCERCGLVPPVDAANISGEYHQDEADWEFLCRRCHMESDGRNEQLRQSGKSRKLPEKLCATCGALFHRDNKAAKFCSRKCYYKSRIGLITNPAGRNGKKGGLSH